MNGYLLDTNAFSTLYDQRLRGRHPALAAVVQRCISEGAELAISAMTLGSRRWGTVSSSSRWSNLLDRPGLAFTPP